MDQALIDSIRKKLDATSSEELEHASQLATASPEEREAIRLILLDRRKLSLRFTLAIVSAIVCGILGGLGTWWQGGSEGIIAIIGIASALFGFAAWYIPGLYTSA